MTGLAGLRVVQAVQVPAAVGGEGADAVAAVGQQPPQLLGGGDTAGVAAGHGDDRDRLVRAVRLAHGDVGGGLVLRAEQFRPEVGDERAGVRVVEDQGGGQAQADRGAQTVAQFHRGQRVEAGLAEGAARVQRHVAAVAEYGGDMGADQLHEGRVAFGGAEGGEPAGERGGVRAGGGGAAGAGGHQAAQHGRELRGPAQHGQVQADREQQRLGGAQGGVEQAEALLGGQRADAGPGHAGHVGVGEVGGQAGALRPEAPGQRVRGQSLVAAVGGQRVEEGVGGGVAGLAGAVDGAGGGGEQHERGEAEVAGQLVQVPGGVRLGPQYGGQALAGLVGQQAVVQNAGEVDDGGQRAVLRYPVEEPRQLLAVGGVAAGHGDLRVQAGEVVGGGAAAAGQHQVADAVLGDQVPGDQGAEHTGAAGDQHGALRVEGRCRSARGGAGEPGHPHGAVTQGELGFSGGRGHGHGGVRVLAVHEDEPPRMLSLGRPDQPPHGGARQVGDVLLPRGHGAPGEDQQPGGGGALVGQPVLYGPQRALGRPVHAGARAVAAGGQHHPGGYGLQRGRAPFVQDGVLGRGRLGGGQGRPVQPVQGVGAGGGGERGRVDGPGDQGLDLGDRGARGVGQPHGQRLVAVQPDPQGGGARRVQRDAGPGERQQGGVPAVGGESAGVQRGVEEGRVQGERVGVDGEFDLGEGLVAAPPQGAQSLEGGPVVVAEGGEAVVGVLGRYGLRARGRPGREVEGGRRGLGGEQAGGVPGPGGVVGALGAGVDGQRAVPGVVGGGHVQLELDGAPLGQGQRCLEGEVGQVRAAELVARAEGEFDQGGAGQQGGAGDGVVGEPGGGRGGEPAGEHGAAPGDGHGGAEQGVAGALESGGGDVAAAGGPAEPVPLALEGVGRQVGGADRQAVEDGRPVHRDAGDEGLAEGGQQALGAAVVAVQGAEGGDVGVGGVGGLLDAVQQHRVRAALHEHPVPGVEQGPGGGLEQHGLPQVGVPVAGVQAGGVEAGAGDGGVERHLGGPGPDVREVAEQPLSDRFDVRGVGGVVHGEPFGAVAVGHDGLTECVQGVGVAGQHHGGGAVDGGHRDPAVVGGEEVAYAGLGQGHRHHAAAAGEFPGDGLAAQGHDAGAVGEGEGAGHAGGGDLALGVADDGGGPDPVGAPHLGQGHHDGPQHGLDDVHALQGLPGPYGLDQVPVGDGGEGRGAVGHARGEHR